MNVYEFGKKRWIADPAEAQTYKRGMSALLDRVADQLECVGFLQEAHAIDIISNTVERVAGVGKSKYLDNPLSVMNAVANKPIIFFDTETTGIHQYRNQITEIAAVRIYGMEELDSFHRRIELSKDTGQLQDKQEKAVQMAVQGKSPFEIRQETNLPADMVKEIYEKKEKFFGVQKVLKMQEYEGKGDLATGDEQNILNEFYDWCAKRPSLMIGQNAFFDLKMINTRLGRQIPNDGVYDTVFFTRFYLYPALAAASAKGDETATKLLNAVKDKKGVPSSSLKPALSALGIDIQGWHGAMADVRSTMGLFKGTYDVLQRSGTVEQDPTYKKTQEEAFVRTLGYKRKKEKP